jgi:hypothetical protein
MNGHAAGWHGGPFTHGRPGVGTSVCFDILPSPGQGKRVYTGITADMQKTNAYMTRV